MAWWPWLLALACVSFAAGGATGWSLLEHVGYALMSLNVLSLLILLAGRRGITISHTLQRLRVTTGDVVKETIVVRRSSLLPCLGLGLSIDGEQIGTIAGWGRSTHTFHRTIVAPHRGRYGLGGGDVLGRDPFSLFSGLVARVAPVVVTVYPRAVEVPVSALRTPQAAPHRARWTSTGDGVPDELRPYRQGDPPTRIHWRSTARVGALMVRDPEPPRHKAVWILAEIAGTFEEQEEVAGLAASAVRHTVRRGEWTGTIVAGRSAAVVPPRTDPGSLVSLLDPLATVEGTSGHARERLLRLAERCDQVHHFILLSHSPWPMNALARLRRIAPVVALQSGLHGSGGPDT